LPAFPASHGCIRITTAVDRLPVGTPMLVYRS
jgi:hypothetical protein